MCMRFSGDEIDVAIPQHFTQALTDFVRSSDRGIVRWTFQGDGPPMPKQSQANFWHAYSGCTMVHRDEVHLQNLRNDQSHHE